MNMNDRLNKVIKMTENDIEFEINNIKECAKNLIKHSERAEQLVKDVDNGNGYYSGFFEFAEDNARKAVKAEERIHNLRSTLSKLKFSLNESE